MAIKSIPCGGFFYDDESVSFEKDQDGRWVMSAAGGGSNYDVVISHNALDGGEITLEVGDYQAVTKKMQEGQIVSGVVKMASQGSGANIIYYVAPLSFEFGTVVESINCVTFGVALRYRINPDNTVTII